MVYFKSRKQNVCFEEVNSPSLTWFNRSFASEKQIHDVLRLHIKYRYQVINLNHGKVINTKIESCCNLQLVDEEIKRGLKLEPSSQNIKIKYKLIRETTSI